VPQPRSNGPASGTQRSFQKSQKYHLPPSQWTGSGPIMGIALSIMIRRLAVLPRQDDTLEAFTKPWLIDHAAVQQATAEPGADEA